MISDQQLEQVRAAAQQGRPDAQFLLSQVCHQAGDYAGMVAWLQKSAPQGHADAQDVLGHCYEKGLGTDKDFELALEHYHRSYENGSMLAAYRSAELLYKSRRGPASKELVRELLCKSASGDCVPALRAVGFLAMHDKSLSDLAARCMSRAAQLGDPVSAFNLGWSLLQERDEAAAESQAK